ncbi:MAG: hypothetical protein C4K58_00125 [Flavobacteriaceae bacterium]|nr:MAG: hypothetical protein C4K58_00125 [Flavobacteriaceae bacterium]
MKHAFLLMGFLGFSLCYSQTPNQMEKVKTESKQVLEDLSYNRERILSTIGGKTVVQLEKGVGPINGAFRVFSKVFFKGTSPLVGPKMVASLTPSKKNIRGVEGVSVQKKQFENTPYFVLTRGESSPKKRVFYLHGGANVMGFSGDHAHFAMDVLNASAGELEIVLVDYLRSPKYTQDQVMAEVVGLYKELSDGTPMLLMGDSAGAGMCASLVQMLKVDNQVLPQNLPEKMVMISPWVDLSMENPEMTAELQSKEIVLNKTFIQDCGKAYAGEKDVKDPLVSPLYAKLSGFPRMFVVSSDLDMISPDAFLWVEKARKAGNKVDFYYYKNEMHDFLVFNSKRHKALVERVAEFLR